MMRVLVEYAALGCVAAGVVAGWVTFALGRDLRGALGVALDFWLAGGMLRLSVGTDWRPLAAAAAILVVRKLLVVSVGRSRGRLRKCKEG
ncbi:hypothetical protein AB0J72_13445 [Dactylosporangium sp. NPDC049742]|uniref:hypothetical protein n=1 Tax=Dactylosporangium sp. NPDC049742 TaxID=3154737 RepID=UPI00344AE7AE